MVYKNPKKKDIAEEPESSVEMDGTELPEEKVRDELKKGRQKVKAEVRGAAIETDTFRAKKGDVVEISLNESKQSPAVKHALQSGNLVVIDLAPVKSEKAPESE